MRTAKTNKTGRMPRLIWVFAGHTVTLLVLSCHGSSEDGWYYFKMYNFIIKGVYSANNAYIRKIKFYFITLPAINNAVVLEQKNTQVDYMYILSAISLNRIWAAAWQNQQNDLCAQRRLNSAWASAQSDQSSLCTQWVTKDPRFLHADSEDSDQTGRMPRLISLHWAHRSFCWFCHVAAHLVKFFLLVWKPHLYWKQKIL